MPNGFLNIDKPTGMTSHDVVAQIRRALKAQKLNSKVGHAGTLDPMATGILVICIGSATRLSDYVMHASKRYQARVKLGIRTDTYDAEGEILSTQDASHIQPEQVEQALQAFRGDIAQIPPMYSAIKQGGRKLYDLARQGQIVERAARHVTIESLQMRDWASPEFTLDIQCSAGTYIRSIAYDLGEALGVGAHLSGLRRESSGAFSLGTSLKLDAIQADGAWLERLLSPREALVGKPSIQLNDYEIAELRFGRMIGHQADHAVALDDASPEVFAYDVAGDLIAILRVSGQHWKPHKVFSMQS